MNNAEHIAAEVLRAAGSSLNHYTPQNQEKIISATTAAIAAMEGWRPIEEAPRDGTPILVWTKYRAGKNEMLVVVPHVEYSGPEDASERLTWQQTKGGFYGIRASHWRHLLAPPQHGDKDW